jgi:asparagine synthase (glutamine-hydrolysing)
MQASGTRVLLSGQGGDQVTNSALDPSSELADLLVVKRFLLLHERLKLWSKRLKKPYLGVLWQSAVLPTLPRKLQAISLRKKNSTLLKWLDKNFVKRTNLGDRILGPSDEFGFNLPSARSQSTGFLSEVKIISAAYRLEFGNIEISYPFLHRPLVEFMQAIPFEQRVRPGETRSLMRRALRNALPEQILNRKSKANPGEALYRGVQREWPNLRRLLTNSHICARGYANSKELLAALDRARHGIDLTVMPAIHLEFWLRSLEHRRLVSKELCTASGITADLAALEFTRVL